MDKDFSTGKDSKRKCAAGFSGNSRPRFPKLFSLAAILLEELHIVLRKEKIILDRKPCCPFLRNLSF